MADLFDRKPTSASLSLAPDPARLADLERLLNGTQADMDEATLTAMMDPRLDPLSEFLHLVDTSKVNRLRVLRPSRGRDLGPT